MFKLTPQNLFRAVMDDRLKRSHLLVLTSIDQHGMDYAAIARAIGTSSTAVSSLVSDLKQLGYLAAPAPSFSGRVS